MPRHRRTKDNVELVAAYARCGTAQSVIAEIIGVSQPTLSKYYAGVIRLARAKATQTMENALYSKGLSGNVPAMMFWLTHRAGWRDEKIVRQVSVDSRVIEAISELKSASNVPEPAWAQFQARLAEIQSDSQTPEDNEDVDEDVVKVTA